MTQKTSKNLEKCPKMSKILPKSVENDPKSIENVPESITNDPNNSKNRQKFIGSRKIIAKCSTGDIIPILHSKLIYFDVFVFPFS